MWSYLEGQVVDPTAASDWHRIVLVVVFRKWSRVKLCSDLIFNLKWEMLNNSSSFFFCSILSNLSSNSIKELAEFNLHKTSHINQSNASSVQADFDRFILKCFHCPLSKPNENLKTSSNEKTSCFAEFYCLNCRKAYCESCYTAFHRDLDQHHNRIRITDIE